MGLATRNNMKIFLRKYGAAMLTASQNNPIYFSLLLSQASLESGYGTSNIAKTKQNTTSLVCTMAVITKHSLRL